MLKMVYTNLCSKLINRIKSKPQQNGNQHRLSTLYAYDNEWLWCEVKYDKRITKEAM